MITFERYNMLMSALKRGADLSPLDFEQLREYETNVFQLPNKFSFAQEILDRFSPNSCPHCGRALNWRDYISPEEIVKYVKGE